LSKYDTGRALYRIAGLHALGERRATPMHASDISSTCLRGQIFAKRLFCRGFFLADFPPF
jgi:hypothetical protein